ncbi:MucR family transcriptional regulator [Sinorhizobium meliloti]|uniref:MucR family transcriptional regulator n=1 Tax=Rhizobium meliloti TaxID=382 RepID=UPI00398D0222
MSESRSSNEGRKLALTSRIVAAYLSRNAVHAGDLPDLIQQTFSSLSGTFPRHQAAPAVEEQRPAVPIKKSVTVDFIICLEDGEKFKSLRRHLMAKYDLTSVIVRCARAADISATERSRSRADGTVP